MKTYTQPTITDVTSEDMLTEKSGDYTVVSGVPSVIQAAITAAVAVAGLVAAVTKAQQKDFYMDSQPINTLDKVE